MHAILTPRARTPRQLLLFGEWPLSARAIAVVAVALVAGCCVGLSAAGAGPGREPHDLPLALGLIGEADDDKFGCSVGRAGDVDGDGFVEWLIGASEWPRTGIRQGPGLQLKAAAGQRAGDGRRRGPGPGAPGLAGGRGR